MKHLVETSGQFMLVDPYTRTTIRHDRPTVARVSEFLVERVARGDIKIIVQELPEQANDAELYEFIAEAGDVATGVAAYLATFGLDDHGRPIETEVPPLVPAGARSNTLTLKK